MSRYLIIIHGSPASGKTYISQWLSKKLHLPLLAKDDLKEELFNHFEYDSINDSKKIGAASFDLLWLLLDKLMPFGSPYIIETAFHLKFSTPKILELTEKYDYKPIQVYCYADKDTLLQRYIHRAQHSRHPGHKDHERAKDLDNNADLSAYYELPLNCPTITIDTTNFEKVNLSVVAERLQEEVNKL